MGKLTRVRMWLIRRLASDDIQVVCNVVFRDGTWFLKEAPFTGDNFTISGCKIQCETPEIQNELIQAFPDCFKRTEA